MGPRGLNDYWLSNSYLDDCSPPSDGNLEELAGFDEWNSMSIVNVRNRLKSERGSVESGAIILPLLFLFLIGMQLAISSHSRNMEKLLQQSSVSQRAISGDFIEGDEFIHIESSGDDQQLDLLVSRRVRPLPALLPSLEKILQREPTLLVEGVAVIENRR